MTRPTARASGRGPRRACRPRPGPHEPGAYGYTGGGASSSGCMIRHVCSTPSCRVNRTPVADHRRVEQHLVRRRALTAHRGELDVEQDRPGRRRLSARCASSTMRTPVDGSSLITNWFGSGPRLERGEPEPRRVLEDEPDLRLRDRQPLSGADEERDSRPAPVVDLEPQRGVRLGRRVRRDAVDRRGSRRTGRARSAPGRRS